MTSPVPDPAVLRRGYRAAGLSEGYLAPTWDAQFRRWFADAQELREPNAAVLATADARGRPSARTVLVKGYDPRGFALFTNLASRKATEAAANPHASLVFPWHDLERQVVVVGTVERVGSAESAAYFRSRPRGSQLGAWASRQSAVIPSRAVLEERRARLSARWPEEVPVPPFWGGLRVVPETVEFWQGRPDRLHDRLRYRRVDDGWVVERLSP
ncbi:MAG TPA: pyridoxamine 5'-phosphate oxidase [Frankiaceae bacterium]|nr:pyridoxamine 5'-phosphate oxidase [Frankiaceae bacterium]